MKKAVMILSLLVSTSYAQAQATNTGNDAAKPKRNFSLDFSQASDSIHYILYVLKSDDQYEEVLVSRNKDIFSVINSEDIQSIDFLRDESAVNAYGPKAKYGAVVCYFKKDKFKRLKKDFNDKLIN